MEWHAEQTKPSFAADGFTNIGAADFGGQAQWQQQQQQQHLEQQQQYHHQQQQQHLPPPPAYTPASAPPDYPGCQYVGAPHYGAPVYYVNSPSTAGFSQPVSSQNVQVNMINGAAPPPPVIIAQTAPLVSSPSSYLGWSIFNFLCCFWPLGLVAIIYSVKVGSSRNHNEATRHSLTARNLNIAATTLAPILAAIVAGALLGSRATGLLGPSSYVVPVYYSYSYTYYYSYLMYYTYFGTYSYLAYSYDWLSGSYTYVATGYTVMTASQYTVASYYQYRADTYYG